MRPVGMRVVVALVGALVGALVLRRGHSQSLERLSTLLDQARIPGVSAVLVDMRRDAVNGSLVFDGGEAWVQHFGFARLGCSQPGDASSSGGEPCFVTDDTVFGVGKISSLLLGTAVMRSLQAGYVDLDTPVVNYLASRGTSLNKRKLPSVWTFHDPLNMLPRITLRHLLSHTACLTDSAYVKAKMTSPGDTRAMLGNFLRQTLPQGISWRGGCVLGQSYHYSTLGLSLAAHAIEYVDDRVDSDFIRYAEREMLPEMGVSNAGWRLAQLTNRGALAEPYSFKLDAAVFNRFYENLPTSLVTDYESQVFDDVCEARLEYIDVTNSTSNTTETETVQLYTNCSYTTTVLTTPDVAAGDEHYRTFSHYGRIDAPATMLRASAKELAKVVALHIDDGVTVAGSDFLNASLVQAMRTPHVHRDNEAGATGLIWDLVTEDGRDLFTVNVGDRNPGMAGHISVHEAANLGLVLLANGDSAVDEQDAKFQNQAELDVDEALALVRAYIFDWYELNYVPAVTPRGINFEVDPPSIVVLNSTTLGIVFKLYSVSATTVGYSVDFAGLDVTEGHHLKVISGSTEVAFFPVGFPAQPYTQAGRDAAVATGNNTGQVRGVVTHLMPDSTNVIEAQIADWNDQAVVVEQLQITTLSATQATPDMAVGLQIVCASATEAAYSATWTNVPIDSGYRMHLSYLAAPYHAPASPQKRMTPVFLATLSGSLTGKIQGLQPGVEHRFKAAIVDFYLGSWLWDEVTVTCS